MGVLEEARRPKTPRPTSARGAEKTEGAKPDGGTGGEEEEGGGGEEQKGSAGGRGMLRNIRASYFSLNWKKNLSVFLISHLQQLSAMETILYLNSISKPSQSTKWNFQKPIELEV